MRNNLRISLLLAAFGLIFVCATSGKAQTVEPMMAGGYSRADVNDREIIDAANFAVKTEAKRRAAKISLVSIDSAERQVVAGLNFRLCLSVKTTGRNKKAAVSQTAQTVVYKNLKQKFALTSWTKGACAAN